MLDLSNKVLTSAALSTNRSISLSHKFDKKTPRVSKEIRVAKHELKRAHNALKRALKFSDGQNIVTAKNNFKDARKALRHITRVNTHHADINRDSNLFSILTKDPSALFRSVRSYLKPSARAVPFVTVNGKKYSGDKVADGLYESISNLKKENKTSLFASPKYENV